MQTKSDIRSYADAGRFLGSKDERPLAHNTRVLRRDDKAIAIRYHQTDVVTYYTDGIIVLNSGGWLTKTTKDRLNAFLPDGFSIYQEQGQWYLQLKDKSVAVYCDGMQINRTDQIQGAGKASDVTAKAKLREQAKRYTAKYIEALLAGRVHAPTGGDCWHCYMRKSGTGETMGEMAKSDHIKQHMKDKYFVPSLLVRAIEVYPVAPIAKMTLGEIWNGNKNMLHGSVTENQLTSSLYRYILAQLGIAN